MSNPKIWPPNLLCTMTAPAAESFSLGSSACPALILGRTQTKAKSATRTRFPWNSLLMWGIVALLNGKAAARVSFSKRSGVRNLSKLAGSLLGWNAVMGGDDLPLSADLDPDIGQTVMVFVGLAVRLAFFVIGPSYDGRVPVHANLEVS